jgi:hypothetical protein
MKNRKPGISCGNRSSSEEQKVWMRVWEQEQQRRTESLGVLWEQEQHQRTEKPRGEP